MGQNCWNKGLKNVASDSFIIGLCAAVTTLVKHVFTFGLPSLPSLSLQ
jgi:hypothetical protein